MNVVACALYKRKLCELNHTDAQQFCMNVLCYQNDRLISALAHAIRCVRPELLIWYNQMTYMAYL